MEHTSGLVAPTYFTNPVWAAMQNQQQNQKGKANNVGQDIFTLGLNALKL
jgi:hypothetical protein